MRPRGQPALSSSVIARARESKNSRCTKPADGQSSLGTGRTLISRLDGTIAGAATPASAGSIVRNPRRVGSMIPVFAPLGPHRFSTLSTLPGPAGWRRPMAVLLMLLVVGSRHRLLQEALHALPMSRLTQRPSSLPPRRQSDDESTCESLWHPCFGMTEVDGFRCF